MNVDGLMRLRRPAKPAGFGWETIINREQQLLAHCPPQLTFVRQQTCCISFVPRQNSSSTMQLALRPNAASLGSAPAASRQAVKSRKTALVVPNAVKDVFMPALRCASPRSLSIHVEPVPCWWAAVPDRC